MANFKSQRMLQFAEIFARLWREEKARGVKHPRVGRMAALMAGYGRRSYSEINTILTADKQYCQLVKRDDVLKILRGLGLERDGRNWREVEAGEPD